MKQTYVAIVKRANNYFNSYPYIKIRIKPFFYIRNNKNVFFLHNAFLCSYKSIIQNLMIVTIDYLLKLLSYILSMYTNNI